VAEIPLTDTATVNVMDKVGAVLTAATDRNDVWVWSKADMKLVRGFYLVGFDTKAFPEQGRQISLGHGGSLLATLI